MSDEPWHLDRKVPIAILFGMFLQVATAIWWASGIDRIVTDHAARLRSMEQVSQQQQVAAATVAAQIGAIRETLDQVRQDQRETNDLLRRYIEGRQ